MAAKTSVQTIYAELDSGMSIEDVAKKHGISVKTVERHYKTLRDIQWWRIRATYEFDLNRIPITEALDFWLMGEHQKGNIRHNLLSYDIATVGDLRESDYMNGKVFGIKEQRAAILKSMMDNIDAHEKKYPTKEDKASGIMPFPDI